MKMTVPPETPLRQGRPPQSVGRVECMNEMTTSPIEPVFEEVLEKLQDGGRIRRELPGGGRIFIDHPLPFLCVYRLRADEPDAAPGSLISSGASYLIAPHEYRRGPCGGFLRRAAAELAARFDSALILELREAEASAGSVFVPAEGAVPFSAPAFRIHAFSRQQPSEVVTALRRGLARIRVHREEVTVADGIGSLESLPGFGLAFTAAGCKRSRVYYLVLEMTPTYRNAETGECYPAVVRALRRGIQKAVDQAFFAFAKTYTNVHPKHYYTLGRRSFVKAVWEVDRRLAEIEASFDLIVQSSPINAEAAWTEFRRSGFDKAPRFLYRPLSVDPPELKRRLFSVPMENIEDASIGSLLLEKQIDIDRRVTMLSDIGTRRFLYGSCALFGTVNATVLQLAWDLLRRLPPRVRKKKNEQTYTAAELAKLAQREIAQYREVDPSLASGAWVRDDIHTGMIVSKGELFIGRQMTATATRARSLLAHEIGVHVLTYHNGTKQPFRQLALGLAGYNSFQEGLAVIAEYFADGLTAGRLRLLAGRVVAVASMLDGADFVEVFRLLTAEFGFTRQTAFTMAMRVFRGGGLTKDALYLTGVVEILDYLRKGGDLTALWIGKISAGDSFLMNELRLRGVLRPPALTPRFLQSDGFQRKYEALMQCQSPRDLLRRKQSLRSGCSQ